jgi:hypothetical protein
MAKRQRRYVKTCIYCGQPGPLTDDHIPPDCLFKTKRTNLLTVKCCDDCHRGTSSDDEILQLYLAMHIGSYYHPDVMAQLVTIFDKLENPGQKGFRREFLDSVRPVNLVSKAGWVIGQTGMYSLDAAPLQRSLSRIVRGLHYKTFRRRLPDDTVITIAPYDHIAQDDELLKYVETELLPEFSSAPSKVIGNDVFGYRVLGAQDNPNASAWLFGFYRAVAVIAIARGDPPAMLST